MNRCAHCGADWTQVHECLVVVCGLCGASLKYYGQAHACVQQPYAVGTVTQGPNRESGEIVMPYAGPPALERGHVSRGVLTDQVLARLDRLITLEERHVALLEEWAAVTGLAADDRRLGR